MLEVIFLFSLALIWIIFATVQDIKTKEIANWLNFSLIAFALGFRFFYSLFSAGNFDFFYQGLLGLLIFFVLGNALYYGKMFAGGDAKLLIALGAVIPFSGNFYENLEIFSLFFLVFLFAAALYSLMASATLCFKNYTKFRREFSKQLKTNKNILNLTLAASVILIAYGFFINLLPIILISILIFLFPWLYIYSKAVDETSMIKKIKTSSLREGDWLYQNVNVRGRTIRANWDGLKKEEISLLRKKYKKILIREGVQFTPVFLISFIIFFWLWIVGLRYPFW